MTSMLVMYVFLGTPAGFVSSRMYKMFGGEQWKSNVICTAFLIPSFVFVTFFVLNLVLWSKESSAAVPFGTLIALVLMWFCISVPLVSGFTKSSPLSVQAVYLSTQRHGHPHAYVRTHMQRERERESVSVCVCVCQTNLFSCYLY
jgi:hypothetical protein